MLCPQCRYEFREGITVCPDCQAPLLSELPPEPKVQWKATTPVKLEAVLVTIDPAILALAKSRLEEADIPYLVKNEKSTRRIPYSTVEIWVKEDDLEEARQLLQEFAVVE